MPQEKEIKDKLVKLGQRAVFSGGLSGAFILVVLQAVYPLADPHAFLPYAVSGGMLIGVLSALARGSAGP